MIKLPAGDRSTYCHYYKEKSPLKKFAPSPPFPLSSSSSSSHPRTPLTALYLRRTATANTSVRRPLSSAAVAPSVSSIAAPRATTSTAAPSRNPPPLRSSPSQAVRPTFLSSASLHLHSRSHRRSSRKPPRNPPAPLDLTTAAQSNSPAPALLPPTEATTQPQQRLRANPLPSRDQNQVAGKNTNNLLDDSALPQAAIAAEDESSPKTWNLRPRRPPMKHKFSICGERRWRWSRGLLHCFANSQFTTSMAASWYDFNSGTGKNEGDSKKFVFLMAGSNEINANEAKLAEFLDRKVVVNTVPVDGVYSFDVVDRATSLLNRIYRCAPSENESTRQHGAGIIELQ
ncbi:hypothetical protein LXL04_022763 [Taraxacum kok-saghyz]